MQMYSLAGGLWSEIGRHSVCSCVARNDGKNGSILLRTPASSSGWGCRQHSGGASVTLKMNHKVAFDWYVHTWEVGL